MTHHENEGRRYLLVEVPWVGVRVETHGAAPFRFRNNGFLEALNERPFVYILQPQIRIEDHKSYRIVGLASELSEEQAALIAPGYGFKVKGWYLVTKDKDDTSDTVTVVDSPKFSLKSIIRSHGMDWDRVVVLEGVK